MNLIFLKIHLVVLAVYLIYLIAGIMENQYCKVGSVTPITHGQNAVMLLEYLYKNFLERASSLQNADIKLREFFELKAQKTQKILNDLV